jgi:hypothetical protein
MKQLILFFTLFTLGHHLISQTSDLWTEYNNSAFKGTQTTLADYSHAGYHYCEVPLPEVNESNYTYFNVVDYGAIPNDGQSDRKAVLQALDAAHNYSSKAVVYFPPGKYRLNERSDFGEKPLIITKNNLVIKGAGQHLTELYFEQPMLMNEGHIKFIPNDPYDSYWRGDEVISTVSSYPEKGSYILEVSNSSNFSPGDVVNIDADLNTGTTRGQGYFTHHEILPGIQPIEDYFFELHQVKQVIENKVYFKEPIHLDLPHMENAKIRIINNLIEESGIQDMTISGNLKEQFKHHNGSRFSERYDLITFQDARNCWARNLRLKNYSDAINLKRCIANTVININLVGNTGHNSIGGSYTYGTLFAYIRENTQTHHGLGGDHSLVNSVFLRCNQYDGLEAHCAWPRASLYDLNEGGFKPRPGGAVKFPHHGKDLCFWNWKVTRPGSNDFWPIGSNYGYFMPFVVVGLHGESFTIADMDEDLLAYESMGTRVTTPESLFEAQLADRLGSLPVWLASESANFEAISRYSSISISSPVNHSVHNVGKEMIVHLSSHPGMDKTQVQEIKFWMSRLDLQSDFELVATEQGWIDQIRFTPTAKGVYVLKTTLLNSRNELEESTPITIFVGNPDHLNPLPVVKASCMPHGTRTSLYSDFVAIGGGEATSFPQNAAMSQVNNGTPFYQVEELFYQEQLKLYNTFGENNVKPIFDDPVNINEAQKLIDGDMNTTIDNMYGWIGSVIQFDLGQEYTISRLDLLWKSLHTGDVKLEVQTSVDAKAWFSMTNDEPLWDFGVQRIGETLARETLPGGLTSSIFLPQRRCRYVRLLAQNFPNGKLAEVQFYGGEVPLLKSLRINGSNPANWNSNTFVYTVTIPEGNSPEIVATPINENLNVHIQSPETLPGSYEIIVSDDIGGFTTYELIVDVAGQGLEDFENLSYTGSFDGSFLGNNNLEWWVNGRVGIFMNSGQSSYFYPSQNGIESQAISGGLSEISFEALNYRQSGARQIVVYVNDDLVLDQAFSGTEKYVVEKTGLNYTGDVVIKIKNASTASVALAIDNISWRGNASDRNAYLQSLQINGTEIENFSPADVNYIHTLASGTGMPVITGIPQSDNAQVNVTYPATLPGKAIVRVTMANGAWLEYTVQLDIASGTGVEKPAGMGLYPNPTTGIVYSKSDNSMWKLICLFDSSGNRMAEWKNASFPLDISHLRAGIYFLQYENQDGTTTYEKIVKK